MTSKSHVVRTTRDQASMPWTSPNTHVCTREIGSLTGSSSLARRERNRTEGILAFFGAKSANFTVGRLTKLQERHSSVPTTLGQVPPQHSESRSVFAKK